MGHNLLQSDIRLASFDDHYLYDSLDPGGYRAPGKSSACMPAAPRLRAFIRGRTPVRDDADDILQEITYQLMKVEQPVENALCCRVAVSRGEMR